MNNEPLKNYRYQEIAFVLEWVQAQESGIVVGIPGCGRATFLRHLAQRPDVVQNILATSQKQYYFVSVDLHDLPDHGLATLYRVILRSFYEARPYFDSTIWSERVAETYQKIEGEQDAFVVQSALRRLLIECENENVQVIFIFNRFDRFLDNATLQMTLTLRALRDSFKNTLTYLLGIGQPIDYLKHHDALHPLLHFTDTQICWLKPLDNEYSRLMIRRRYRYQPPLDSDDEQLVVQLSGGNPMLIRVLCNEWLALRAIAAKDDREGLKQLLNKALELTSIDDRLRRLWVSFSSAEQALLTRVSRYEQEVKLDDDLIGQLLLAKGICRVEDGFLRIHGRLFRQYVLAQNPTKLGRIVLNKRKNEFYRGEKRLDLSRMQEMMLRYLLEHATKRIDAMDIVVELWPEDVDVIDATSTTNRLHRLVSDLRRAIEPDPARPIYLITRKGRPSHYQFFPDGRPQSELDY